jgi:hypothetical protein
MNEISFSNPIVLHDVFTLNISTNESEFFSKADRKREEET